MPVIFIQLSYSSTVPWLIHITVNNVINRIQGFLLSCQHIFTWILLHNQSLLD